MVHFTNQRRFLTFVLMLIGCMTAMADDGGSTVGQTVVRLDKAGTLADKIDKDQKYKITDLKVVGDINGSDVRLLRDMAGSDYMMYYTDGQLANLDLSEANIVEGGDPYFERYDMGMYDVQCTKNDEFGDEMFFNCPRLVSIVIPSSAKSVNFCALSVCDKLESVTIPEGVTTIGACAFEFDENIVEMKLPSTVTEIGNRAFYECKGLKKVNIPEGVKELGFCCLSGCNSLESITLPSSLTTLGRYALSHCKTLKSVAIPSSVTQIEDLAFMECTGLESVYVGWDTPLAIEDNTFYKINKEYCKLYVPKGTSETYKATTWGKSFENIVEYDVTGLSNPSTSNDLKEVARHTADGRRTETQAKGLNIVRFSDGSVKKFIVK